jgi:RecA/RadA recombinase
MNKDIAKIFNLLKKDEDIADSLFAGDDIHMKSIAPYGIPSGLPMLDLYLGYKGGLPASKIVEYYGAPMTGKTTAALQAGAEWQQRGGLVFFHDTEESFSPRRAMEVGLNPKEVIKHEPETMEETFEYMIKDMDALEETGYDKPVLFIVDSVTGVPTQADADGDISSNERPGFEAKQIKRGIKKVNPKLGNMKSKPTIIFINHIISTFNTYGKQSASGGGKGIKFYAAVRVEFKHSGQLKDGERRTGQKIAIEIEKLKGGHLEYPKFFANLTNACGFDKAEGLYKVMLATGYAHSPGKKQTTTILTGTDAEEEFKNKNFNEWVQSKGGYEKVYAAWRKHATAAGTLIPWGTGETV